MLLAACESPHPDLGAREHELASTQKISELPAIAVNYSSLPRGYAVVNDAVLFFSAARKGLYRTDGTPAGTHLVRDLEPTLDSYQTTPRITAFNNRAYWSQSGALWVSDGTGPGTARVAAFDDDYGPTAPVVYKSALYFGADAALYRSDGTAAGTEVVAPVAALGTVWKEMDGSLYFPCTNPSTGRELCVTDGTEAGTHVVKDINPGISGSSPRLLGVLGSKLFFSAIESGGFRGLWVTDGTEAGTLELLAPGSDIDAIHNYEDDFAILGDSAFVPCYTSSAGVELCRTDGTPEGTSAIDIVPGSGSGSPGSLTVFNARLFLAVTTPDTGRELWTSDGTAAGTSLFLDIGPGTERGVSSTRFIVVGDELYFVARTSFVDSYELWKTDGTVAGTAQVKDILPPGNPVRYPLSLGDAAVLGTRLIFAADDGVTGLEPWVTDGTAAGTQLLQDLTPDRSIATVYEMRAVHGAVYLAFTDNQSTNLWKSDGTTAGTRPFQEFDYGTAPRFTPVDHWLFYVGERSFVRSLWKTDGTTTGTTRVKELPGSATELHAVGDRLAFSGTTPSSAYALWLSDGTEAGTDLTDPLVYNASRLGVANDRLWLTGLYSTLGNELWTSDGTDAGTVPVADIRAGYDSSEPGEFAALNGQTLFAADDGVAGRELWKTDGTADGTALVADINPGSAGSGPTRLFAWSDMVLFWASSGDGTALWKTDGTAAGTALLREIRPGGDFKFLGWGDYVFFAAADASGIELWRSDGTMAGTVMVSDIYPGPLSSDPKSLVLAGPDGPLFFAAEEPTAGREIWQLTEPTGTPELLAEDITPGVQSSWPEFLAVHGSSLMFIADDGAGNALYKLEGVGPDATPPAVDCPGDVIETATSSSGVAVTYPPPQATDDSGEGPTVTADWPSGAVFPVGVTDVTVRAIDGANNASTCTFRVEVLYQGEPDAGMPDAGPVTDAGTGADAGMASDAGPGADAGLDAGPGGDAGVSDAGPEAPSDSGGDGRDRAPGGGCGCDASRGNSWPPSALMFMLVAGLLRRRPRTARRRAPAA